MASWHYAFFFPGYSQKLEPANVIGSLVSYELELDNFIRPAIVIDSEGHLEHGDEVILKNSHEELMERLKRDEQFLVECRNKDIFFTCCFATRYFNPYIMLGWPRRLFSELNDIQKDMYWQMLGMIAKTCNASYVIIVNDPPDFFEDRFLEIDGQRILEKAIPSGSEYDIVAVWIDDKSSDRIPFGLRGPVGTASIDGFMVYSA